MVAEPIGSLDTILVCIRGNSGSGKSSIGSGKSSIPQASEFTAEHMSGWYAAHDVLGWPDELVLPETTGLDEAVQVIAAAAGLPQVGRDDDLLPSVPSP